MDCFFSCEKTKCGNLFPISNLFQQKLEIFRFNRLFQETTIYFRNCNILWLQLSGKKENRLIFSGKVSQLFSQFKVNISVSKPFIIINVIIQHCIVKIHLFYTNSGPSKIKYFIIHKYLIYIECG